MDSLIKKLNLYQAKAVNAALKALGKDGKALVRMATGTGKTETGIKLFEALDNNNDKRLLWLTHQQELIKQAAERLINRAVANNRFEHTDVGIFNAEFREKDNKIVMASIPTLARGTTLVKNFDPNDFDLIIVDECHHSPANTWDKAIEYFNAFKVGLTATPERPDQQRLDKYFGEICYDLPFHEAQRLGLLAPERGMVVLTNSVIEGMVDRNGEYTAKQLEKLYTSKNRNEIIVRSYINDARKTVIAGGMKPKTICACINVEHARRTSALFNARGISAQYVCADMSESGGRNRKDTIDKFVNTHDIEVLCVVGLVNEGVDIPNANILLMCRPTQSVIVYSQLVGRVARPKKFFYVLDLVDQTSSGYQTYTLNKLTNKRLKLEHISTEYVDSADPVVLEKIIHDVMGKALEFEVGMRAKFDASKVTEENLRKWIKNQEYRPWYV